MAHLQQTQNLNNATDIVLTGASAGGIGEMCRRLALGCAVMLIGSVLLGCLLLCLYEFDVLVSVCRGGDDGMYAWKFINIFIYVGINPFFSCV